jgi:lipopolysaccharide transport system ATP-binding protein
MIFDVSTRAAGVTLGSRVTRARVRLEIPHLDLPGGDYVLDVGVFQRDWECAYDYHWGVYAVRVEGASGGKGVLLPPQRWTVEPR